MAKIGDCLHAVILAGGAGERFWPASRQATPKPLLRVGPQALVERHVERLVACGFTRIVINNLSVNLFVASKNR